MRSGAPDSLDRIVSVSYGILALDQIAHGVTGRMVALHRASTLRFRWSWSRPPKNAWT